MPVTFAHPAAVLPLLRTPLPMTALALGAMVPDVPLFVQLYPWYDVTHSLLGILSVDIVLATVATGLWVLLVRDACVDLAPDVVRDRLAARGSYSWRDWLLTPVAASIGAASHVGWDLFTHQGRWGDQHIPWLAETHAGLLGTAWLQHLSSVVATGILLIAIVRHLRRAPYRPHYAPRRLPRWTSLAVLGVLAWIGGMTIVTWWGYSVETIGFFVLTTTCNVAVVLLVAVAAVWRLRGIGVLGRRAEIR